MSDEIIGMDDMMAVYQVTDEFGIDRESISVPLEKGTAVAASNLPPAESSSRSGSPSPQPATAT